MGAGVVTIYNDVALSSSEWYAPAGSYSDVSYSQLVSPIIANAPAAWIGSAAARVQELRHFNGDWDGYGSSSLSSRLARAVLRYLAEPLWALTPPPRVSLTSDGGLSVEWRSQTVTMEMEFTEGGLGDVYVHDVQAGEEWEGAVEELPDGLDKWAWRLSSR